jgi:hypothetical protein
MRRHWHEFRLDARMNWLYSSDTMNESNANVEYMSQWYVSDEKHRIYVLVTYIVQDEQNASCR